MKWARVENDIVVETTNIDPKGRFVLDIEAQFIPCSNEVEPGCKYENGVFTSPPVATLSERKTSLRTATNAERDRREQGGFTYLDKTFDSDQASVIRINAAVNTAVAAILASSTFSVEWTCADNSKIILDAQQFLGLAAALADHSNTQHVRARSLKDQVDAALNETDLAAIKALLEAWKAEA